MFSIAAAISNQSHKTNSSIVQISKQKVIPVSPVNEETVLTASEVVLYSSTDIGFKSKQPQQDQTLIDFSSAKSLKTLAKGSEMCLFFPKRSALLISEAELASKSYHGGSNTELLREQQKSSSLSAADRLHEELYGVSGDMQIASALGLNESDKRQLIILRGNKVKWDFMRTAHS